MSVSSTSSPNYSATLKDLAEHFGLSYRTMRRYVAAGIITGHRIGPRVIRFNLAAVEAELKDNAGAGSVNGAGKPVSDTTGTDGARRAERARARQQFGLDK